MGRSVRFPELRRRAIALLAGLAALALPASSWAGARETWILEGLQDGRSAAGTSPLERRADLDGVALRRAEAIAALPHENRLAYAEPLDAALRESGIRRYERATLHVDMLRGYASPSTAFLDSWRRYAQGWAAVTRAGQDSIGLATVTAADGWIVLVAVLLEELPSLARPRELERRTLEAVNRVREEHGLSVLAPDRTLARAAREHSRDMAARGYFSHRSPEGHEAADRVDALGLTFRLLGENIQMSRNVRDPVEFAVRSWLDSAGHRETILTRDYVSTGVGVAVADDSKVYFTQLFAAPPGVRDPR